MTHGERAPAGIFLRRAFLAPSQSSTLWRYGFNAPEDPAQVVRDGVKQSDEQFRRGTCVDLGRHAVAVQDLLLAALPALEGHFGVSLSGCDRPKLLTYRRGDFFKAHRDRGHDERLPLIARRRLTAIVFLQDGAGKQTYGGGELFVYLTAPDVPVASGRTRVTPDTGMLLAFPAERFHEVKRVRWGERRTIVSWFH